VTQQYRWSVCETAVQMVSVCVCQTWT